MPINQEIARLTDLMNNGSASATTFAERALCYRMQGRFLLSERDLDVAIDLEPNNPVYYMDRGFSCHMQANHKQAVADFTRSIELAGPASELAARALRLRINAYEGADQPENAMQDVNLLVEWLPDDLQIRAMRAARLINSNKLQEAWGDIEHMLSIDDTDLSTCVLYARYLLMRQQYDQAEEILHRVLADHRDNEDFVEMYRPYWTEARQHQGKDVIPDW
ncbi:MAG: hypothetical protein H6670_14360 [Anaerolineaceae bacterium]|nr:hypothetical protein [Anaerolineaceae bacterium]